MTLPSQRPARPGWFAPFLVASAGIAVLLVAAVVLLVLMRPGSPHTLPIVLSPVGPAAEACAQLDQADTTDLALMQSIGAKAATTTVDENIRLAGASLQDGAELAIAAQGLGDQRSIDTSRADVTRAAADLRHECVRAGDLPR